MTEQEQKRVGEIRAREEKATPGPWARNVNSDDDYNDFGSSQTGEHIGFVNGKDDDATFIINSRSDIPFLLDLVKRQQKIIDMYESDRAL